MNRDLYDKWVVNAHKKALEITYQHIHCNQSNRNSDDVFQIIFKDLVSRYDGVIILMD